MDFPSDIPFAHVLGLQLLRCEGGEAEVACALRPELCNSWGVAHGGVLMGLLDVAMAMAGFGAPGNTERAPCGTIEMKTSFMRPSRGPLLARARVLHGTSRLVFCESSVYEQDGQQTGHATGTFTYIRRGGAAGPPP